MSASVTVLFRVLFALSVLGLLAAAQGCASPVALGLQNGDEKPRLEGKVFVMADGARLAFRSWPSRRPRAVILALHGFNDYANAFAMPGPWLAQRGFTVYAYDQRGFGRNPNRGLWAGEDVLVTDLRTVARTIKQRHPRLPVYLLGVSMGGAVVLKALANDGVPEVHGAILVAPAVWGWRAMNPLYKSALWIAAHTVPSYSPTGESLKVQPSDNIEMLRALGRDPLVIKQTRIDAIYGLVGLMDQAYEAAPRVSKPVLYLYGRRDELVPEEPTRTTVRALAGPTRFVEYENGWHMLLRDRQRTVVWEDINAWVRGRSDRLPSGEEVAVTGQVSASESPGSVAR